MISRWWARKTLAFLIAFVVAIGGVALFSLVAHHPDPAPTVLGSDWRCVNYIVLTSCSPLPRAPVPLGPRKSAVLARWV